MAETSFNAVRAGVIAKLKQAFPTIDRYGEEISQGFEAPCFFVKLFPGSQKRILGNRYYRYHAFDIHYFTDEEYVNDALHDMAERLYDALEYIQVNGDLVAGVKMEHEIVEGVLHFFVHFNMTVVKVQPEVPVMDQLTIRTRLRGEGE